MTSTLSSHKDTGRVMVVLPLIGLCFPALVAMGILGTKFIASGYPVLIQPNEGAVFAYLVSHVRSQSHKACA